VKVCGTLVFHGTCRLQDARFSLDGPSILTSISADELLAKARKDAEGTRRKYMDGPLGKSLIVTGPLVKLVKMHGGVDGASPLLFIGKTDPPMICAYMNHGFDSRKTLEALATGQTVKLAGRFTCSPSGQVPGIFDCLLIADRDGAASEDVLKEKFLARCQANDLEGCGISFIAEAHRSEFSRITEASCQKGIMRRSVPRKPWSYKPTLATSNSPSCQSVVCAFGSENRIQKDPKTNI
jgi:hypothetical protein